MGWGLFDFQSGADHPYSSAQTFTGGSDAVTGIGVRRVQLVIDRTAALPGADPAVMHFDVLNMTGGNPDDTWTSGDFTNVETSLDALWAALKPYVDVTYKLSEYRFYRIGPGIVPPNPAERVSARSVVGTGSGTKCPPQVACSLTFRTAVRLSWGRTYLPLGGLASGNLISDGELTSTATAALAAALGTYVTSLATNDFYPVVYSKTKGAALSVEKVEVDSNLDVIRRRRWKRSAYRTILP